MTRRFFYFGIIIVAGLVFSSSYHKFYVSITQVDVNKDTHKLEISARIFSDDFEASIWGETGQKLGLGTGKELPKADSILYNYLLSTLNFKQDSKEFDMIFVGKEVEADVTWVYLESKDGISLTSPVDIRNSVLQERFPDQKNIVNFKFGDQTLSQIHTKDHPVYAYSTSR